MNELALIGGGGHARVLASVAKRIGRCVLGYTDPVDRGVLLGLPYLGNDDVLAALVQRYPGCGAIVAIGKVDTSGRRLDLQRRVASLGFGLSPLVSPTAVVNEEVVLGAGTAVLDGVVMNTGTEVGDCCILNTHCTVEHDCLLGDNVHVAPGAVLSGGVSVGRHSVIGAGAVVAQSVAICSGCLVGAGAVVVKDLVVPGTYVGNPARPLR